VQFVRGAAVIGILPHPCIRRNAAALIFRQENVILWRQWLGEDGSRAKPAFGAPRGSCLIPLSQVTARLGLPGFANDRPALTDVQSIGERHTCTKIAMTGPAAGAARRVCRRAGRIPYRHGGGAVRIGFGTCVSQLRKSVAGNRSNGGTTSPAQFGDAREALCRRQGREASGGRAVNKIGVAVDGVRDTQRTRGNGRALWATSSPVRGR